MTMYQLARARHHQTTHALTKTLDTKAMVAFYYITKNVLAAAGNLHRVLRYAGNYVAGVFVVNSSACCR
jgi:hypothetical protein